MSDAAARERALIEAERFRQTDPMFLGERERGIVALADALAAEQERTRRAEAERQEAMRVHIESRDEVDRLTERTRQLEEALREIAFGFDGDEFEDTADAFDRHRDIARAALDSAEAAGQGSAGERTPRETGTVTPAPGLEP